LLLIEWTEHRLLRDALDRLRDEPATRQSRVVVWADRSKIRDAIHALELGVDDCLPVPFERVELIARINACLRRCAAGARPDPLAAGPLLLDKAGHCLWINDRPIELAPTEFRLMAFFLENRGRVFGRPRPATTSPDRANSGSSRRFPRGAISPSPDASG
jgi:two-component system phosphate regulon response regulator PhoB